MNRNYMIALLASAVAAGALASSSPFGLIGGTYVRPHEVMTFDGDVAVEDTLILDHADEGYAFSVRLKHSFDQECSVEGMATMVMDEQGDTATLTYLQPVEQVKKKRCMLNMSIDSQHITLSDPHETCAEACGMGGALDGVRFKRSSRR